MRSQSKNDAQLRVDRIHAFASELETLEEENIITLTDEQHKRIQDYHGKLTQEYSNVYDIDATHRDKQLSLGMKITSFLGALALAASVFFLFYQFWGLLDTSVQIVILVATPLALLMATKMVSQREKSGYFAKIFAMVTLAAFVLNLVMLGQIFNITPSENAFLIWAFFAFLLAYATNARLLLGVGIIAFSFFLSAKTGTWSGCYWIGFGERPEHFFPAAVAIFALSLIPQRRYSDFLPIYRTFAMLLLLLPILILSNWGYGSYLPASRDVIEGFYQIAGFSLSALAVYVGIKKGWGDLINSGNIFFTIFLYTKFFDWWWEWMPKYLFFLILGLIAIAMLWVFKYLRGAVSAKEVL